MKTTMVPRAETRAAVAVLCDAFYNYPVMPYVLGSAPDYGDRLQTLIGFFVRARILRDEPVLGVVDEDGDLAGVALVTLPGDRPSPPALDGRSCGVNSVTRRGDATMPTAKPAGNTRSSGRTTTST